MNNKTKSSKQDASYYFLPDSYIAEPCPAPARQCQSLRSGALGAQEAMAGGSRALRRGRRAQSQIANRKSKHAIRTTGSTGSTGSTVQTYSIQIQHESDISFARQNGKRLAEEIGLCEVDQTFVATSISELATNLFFHAVRGMITINTITLNDHTGLEIVSQDKGPGIEDVNLALKDGYSTNRGLGGGLGGVRRMLDEFEIESTPGKGTRITARIWQKE